MQEDLQQLLKDAMLARSTGVGRAQLWERLHDLAEAAYEPAIDFFLSFLDDPDWDWRLEGLQLLGFHYRFPPDSHVIVKIRQVVLTDPNDFVRGAAASALGSQLARAVPRVVWPDRTLVHALQQDRDEQVRYSAFESLLASAGLPVGLGLAEAERLKKLGKSPTLADVSRILQDRGIKPDSCS